MTWRVLTTPACEPDVRALKDEERTAVVEDLFAWVEEGPPRSAPRRVGGAVLFDDPLPCGYSVSYFVDEVQRYVAPDEDRCRILNGARSSRSFHARPSRAAGHSRIGRRNTPAACPPF